MPELPEVEFCAQVWRRVAVGRRVVAAGAEPGSPLRGDLDPARWSAGLTGRRIEAVHRRGKQLTVVLDAGLRLLVHLGMTGKWVACGPEAPVRRGRRAWLHLDDHQRFDYLDPRRFGRLWLLPEAEATRHPEVVRLGPDALAVAATPGALHRALRGCRRPIKEALLDQHRVAGIGNIYAVEGLFAAGLHPDVPAEALSPEAADALAQGVGAAMEASLAREDATAAAAEITYLHEAPGASPFQVYGRAGQPCRRCGAPVLRQVQHQRSTFFCGVCQRHP